MKKSEERLDGKEEARRQAQCPSHPEKGLLLIPDMQVFLGLPSGIHNNLLFFFFNNLLLKLRKSNNICLKTFSSQGFLHGSLYILISQAVDQGIQHGDHWSVEHGGHILLGQGTGCGGFQVYESGRSIEHPHGCKVGAAGAESFGPSLCGSDAEDTGQDEGIGNKDC